MILPALAAAALIAMVFLTGGRVERTALVAKTNSEMHVVKDHILYQDWRGTSLEAVDEFTFSHSWTGSVPVGEVEEEVVKPAELVISADRPIEKTYVEVSKQLTDDYNVQLDGQWNLPDAESLLETFEGLCATHSRAKGTPKENCHLNKLQTWRVVPEQQVDDISIKHNGDIVKVTADALKHATPRKATLGDSEGNVKSYRLEFAVLRVISDWGRKQSVINQVLRRRFGAQLDVDCGYTALTESTTLEDHGRFMEFKPPELLFMVEAWTLMPAHMHTVAGLKYVTRRQQGLNHPYYGSTTAVSWPENRDESYQEYMDYSFNQDGYTSRHLFVHEKSHFFWARHWDTQLKEDWEAVGDWAKNAQYSEDWMTPQTVEFSSDYGASNNPDEDIAECLSAYVLHPMRLQARAPKKHAFLRDQVAHGVQYVEEPSVLFAVENSDGYYRYPAAVKRLEIKVAGRPEDDKQVDVTMLVDVGQGWHSASHAEVQLSGPSGGRKTIKLETKEGAEPDAANLVAMTYHGVLSKHFEKGFWSASQIVVKDTLGNERWVKVDEYSWRLYLNNQAGTAWPPRYREKSMKLEAKWKEHKETGVKYPVLTAEMGVERTGAPLDLEGEPAWMRLAAKKSAKGGGMTQDEWQGYGASWTEYPVYKAGGCTVPESDYDGTCSVEWELSPYSAAGQYYVAMLAVEDEASNKREQFFTAQPEGWTCCGKVGNTGDDEYPVLLELLACKSGDAEAKECVGEDHLPPQLDRLSVAARVHQKDDDKQHGSGTVTVTFKARDDKSGVGTIMYRIMDPQGMSHSGYLEHDNSYGPVFTGDVQEWKEYKLEMALPRGSPKGTWRLESLEMHDKAGNRKHHQFIELLQFVPTSK